MYGGGFAVGVWECAFDWWAKLFLQVPQQITLDAALQKVLLPKREVGKGAGPTVLLLLTQAWLCSGSCPGENTCSFPLLCSGLSPPKAEPRLWSVKDGWNAEIIILSSGDSKMGSFSRKGNWATYYLRKYSHYCCSFDVVTVVFQEVFMISFSL